MVDRLGVQRLDEAEVVGDRGGVRQQFADPRAALAVLLELELARRDRERLLRRGHAGEPLPLADRIGQLLREEILQLRLVIEQIDLRRAAGLEEIDDALGFGSEVRRYWRWCLD